MWNLEVERRYDWAFLFLINCDRTFISCNVARSATACSHPVFHAGRGSASLTQERRRLDRHDLRQKLGRKRGTGSMACEVTRTYPHGLFVLIVPEAEKVLPETRKSSSNEENHQRISPTNS